MANSIFLDFQPSSGKLKTPLALPLLDDPSIELSSEFNNLGEMFQIPLIDFAQAGLSYLSGTVNNLLFAAQNVMSFPKWNKTNPATISLKLAFYSKTNSFLDVVLPVWELCSLAIIKETFAKGISSGQFSTPGVNLQNIEKFVNFNDFKNALSSTGKGSLADAVGATQGSVNDAAQAGGAQEGIAEGGDSPQKGLKNLLSNTISSMNLTGGNNHFVSVFIPGVIYLRNAMIGEARPVFSKQVTSSGYPLWAELELTFKSVLPATDKMFRDVKMLTTTYQKNTEGIISEVFSEGNLLATGFTKL